MKESSTAVTLDSAKMEVIDAIGREDIALMYCDTLNDIATYITLADDPDLEADRQLHWLRIIAMIRKDIQALAGA